MGRFNFFLGFFTVMLFTASPSARAGRGWPRNKIQKEINQIETELREFEEDLQNAREQEQADADADANADAAARNELAAAIAEGQEPRDELAALEAELAAAQQERRAYEEAQTANRARILAVLLAVDPAEANTDDVDDGGLEPEVREDHHARNLRHRHQHPRAARANGTRIPAPQPIPGIKLPGLWGSSGH